MCIVESRPRPCRHPTEKPGVFAPRAGRDDRNRVCATPLPERFMLTFAILLINPFTLTSRRKQTVADHRDESPLDLSARVARLSPGQRACLDLVDDHATSKEIARQLGISRHTVDARLRQAIQILGVSSRREAAVIWRASVTAQGYQPFAYQSSRLETPVIAGELAGHGEEQIIEERPLGLAGIGEPIGPSMQPAPPAARAPVPAEPALHVAEATAWTWTPGTLPASGPPASPPLRLWGGANDLTPGQRLAGILIVMISAMLAFGLLLSGMSALIQLRS